MALVVLHGLKSRPELNGKVAELVRAYPSKGRWEVRVDGETFGVKPSCMEPHEDAKLEKLRHRQVLVQDVSLPDVNGTAAQCGHFLADIGRWQVTMGDGSSILLRSDCLSLVESGASLKDPVIVVEHEGFGDAGSGMPQKALAAAECIEPGQVIFHEKPIIKVARKDAWEAQCRAYAEAFLAAAPDQKTASLAMFAEPDIRMQRTGASWKRSCDMVQVLKKLSLYDTIPESDHEEVWKFMRIMQSNCFDCGDSSVGLFAWLCRANHSCCPNSVRHDHDGGKSLIALRNLAEGEEITINYLSDIQLLEPCASRRRQLEFVGFECNCGRCRSGVDDVRKFCCPMCCDTVDVITQSECEASLSTCPKCENQVDFLKAREILKDENTFVDGVLQLDQNPLILSSHPEFVEQLLSTGRGTYAPSHWAIAKIHSLGVEQCRQKKQFAKALDHSRLELEFWSHHLRRPSQAGAWKRKLRGDIAAENSDFMLALLEYSRALSELNHVLIGGCYFDELRRSLRLALEFQAKAQVQTPAVSAPNPLNLPLDGCPQQ